MPYIKVNNVELFFEESGSGPEAIVFSHGLLMDHSMFAAQRAAFEAKYRVIAYDQRGQGQSHDPGRGYDMDALTDDAAALIGALRAAPCHFAGLSMGGFIGMRLGARRPELLRSLTVMNTGAGAEPLLSRLRYNFLARLLKVVGLAPFVGIAVKELFGASTRKDPAKRAMLAEWTEKLRSRPKTAANSLLGVMNRHDISAELAAIRCPVLVITGEEDTARPPRDSEDLAAVIRGARLVRIPKSGHSSSLEQPEAVIAAMREFLTTTPFLSLQPTL